MENIEVIEPVKVPDSYIEFAKEIAKAANKFDINSINVEFTPLRDYDHKERVNLFTAEAKISYSSTDGRGRPCEHLSIKINSESTVILKSDTPSFS